MYTNNDWKKLVKKNKRGRNDLLDIRVDDKVDWDGVQLEGVLGGLSLGQLDQTTVRLSLFSELPD